MVPVELLHHGAAPGKTRDVRWAESERVDDRREAVRVVREAEADRHIIRVARARLVPGDNRELVCQGCELGPPHAAVHPGAVHEHEQRTLADALVGDLEPAHPNDLHGPKLHASDPRYEPRAALPAPAASASSSARAAPLSASARSCSPSRTAQRR